MLSISTLFHAITVSAILYTIFCHLLLFAADRSLWLKKVHNWHFSSSIFHIIIQVFQVFVILSILGLKVILIWYSLAEPFSSNCWDFFRVTNFKAIIFWFPMHVYYVHVPIILSDQCFPVPIAD